MKSDNHPSYAFKAMSLFSEIKKCLTSKESPSWTTDEVVEIRKDSVNSALLKELFS